MPTSKTPKHLNTGGGGVLSSSHDYTQLTHVKAAAFKMVDIESLNRSQRRNWIARCREELKHRGYELTCGGNLTIPHYVVRKPIEPADPSKGQFDTLACNGKQGFQVVCALVLKHAGELGPQEN